MSLDRCGTWTLSVSKRGESSPQQVPGATLKEGGEPAKQVRGRWHPLSLALGLLGCQSAKGAIALVESRGGSLLGIQSCACYYRQSYFIRRLLKV